MLRKYPREKRNKRTEQIFAEFASVNRLHDVHREPVRRKTPVKNAPEPQEFPAHFGDICRCDVGCDTPGLNMLDRFACVKKFQKIPRFEVHELQMVFEQLR